jgi:Ran GTPase-activating protein (RanGAP) involved in mRNA processing and transport
MAIGDDDLLLLAKYIQMDPALRSLSLASNSFTDVGLNEVITALSKNTKLNHINLLENAHLSDWSLKNL